MRLGVSVTMALTENSSSNLTASSPRSRSERPLDDLLVCSFLGDTLHCVRARQIKSQATYRNDVLATKQEIEQFVNALPAKCTVIVLLPRRAYLCRSLELPSVESHELASMLQLEVQAYLPPDFEDAAISYCSLVSGRANYDRFEAYVARNREIEAFAARLVEMGLKPDYVLPSAIAWLHVLKESDADLMIWPLEAGIVEMASVEADGSVTVRSIGSSSRTPDPRQIEQSIGESLRSRLSAVQGGGDPLVVEWMDNGLPPVSSNSRVTIRSGRDISVSEGMAGEGADPAGPLFLRRAAEAMLKRVDITQLRQSNLLPRQMVAQSVQLAVRRSVTVAAIAFAIAVVLLFASLRVLIYRYEIALRDLDTKATAIRAEGQQVTVRLKQLGAIRQAQQSRDDFARVLSGLADATPKGVSYNLMELNDAGAIKLQGQADSLSLSFQLPELLAKQTAFTGVLVQDAGQSNKGEGSISEFRLDCRLRREGDSR